MLAKLSWSVFLAVRCWLCSSLRALSDRSHGVTLFVQALAGNGSYLILAFSIRPEILGDLFPLLRGVTRHDGANIVVKKHNG
jgi:hypothetical protein